MAVAFVREATGNSGSGTTTLSCTLGATPTSGNLLVFCMAGDKNTGALTLAGFTELYSLLSASVSLYFWYKVSAGTETTINPSWATSSVVGNTAWYAEYEDSSVSGSTWAVSGQASNITSEATVTSQASGTTGSLTAAGMGIAANAIDSSQNVVSGVTWSNSYTEKYSATGFSGRGGIFVATRSESAGSTTSTTFSYTGTADQNSGAIAVFTKSASTDTPSPQQMDVFVNLAGSRKRVTRKTRSFFTKALVVNTVAPVVPDRVQQTIAVISAGNPRRRHYQAGLLKPPLTDDAVPPLPEDTCPVLTPEDPGLLTATGLSEGSLTATGESPGSLTLTPEDPCGSS